MTSSNVMKAFINMCANVIPLASSPDPPIFQCYTKFNLTLKNREGRPAWDEVRYCTSLYNNVIIRLVMIYRLSLHYISPISLFLICSDCMHRGPFRSYTRSQWGKIISIKPVHTPVIHKYNNDYKYVHCNAFASCCVLSSWWFWWRRPICKEPNGNSISCLLII